MAAAHSLLAGRLAFVHALLLCLPAVYSRLAGLCRALLSPICTAVGIAPSVQQQLCESAHEPPGSHGASYSMSNLMLLRYHEQQQAAQVGRPASHESISRSADKHGAVGGDEGRLYCLCLGPLIKG